MSLPRTLTLSSGSKSAMPFISRPSPADTLPECGYLLLLLQQITLKLGRPLQPLVSKSYELFSCFEIGCTFSSQQKAARRVQTPLFGIIDHGSHLFAHRRES